MKNQRLSLLAIILWTCSCSASPQSASKATYASAGAPAESRSTSYSNDYDQSAPAPDYGGSANDESDYEDMAEPQSASAPMAMAPTSPGASAPVPPPMPKAVPPAGPSSTGLSAAGRDTNAPKPLLIYRATINLAVFEASKSINAVEALAKELGGYLVERSDLGISVRVPAGEFDGALETIAKMGDELHRQVNVQDVTAEFRDLQIRLKNLEVVRDRLAALLSRATTVEEALTVERELERVSGDIESIKGKLKLFQELISFSTITVSFEARPAETISSEIILPFPWLNNLGLGPLLDLN